MNYIKVEHLDNESLIMYKNALDEEFNKRNLYEIQR